MHGMANGGGDEVLTAHLEACCECLYSKTLLITSSLSVSNSPKADPVTSDEEDDEEDSGGKKRSKLNDSNQEDQKPMDLTQTPKLTPVV